MGTPFSEVLDMALITIKDYKLDNLFTTDRTTFDSIMQGYMLRGLPKFVESLTPLTYNINEEQFTNVLDDLEISIVADWAVIEWYTGELQDVLEFKDPLNDSDFKRYSTGQNLKPRHDYLAQLREKVKQDTTDYQLLHLTSLPFFEDLG